ncbi:hypothetical protein D7W82_38485 [Corallococcus sp. CA049B]|uniref:hypothetical protein n=1 Tax=Corallococcus sp. CA049B TaxID=2316730 RepID=UPI000EA1F486|nr:hypothetical protein [Corallococcus sp. CA049B]RKG73968.1 hypothetical protein D7W82_38485 [Corallococcus sp. CA049B]
MGIQRSHWAVPWAWAALMVACSTPNPDVRVRELPDGQLQVTGPLAGPFPTVEELAGNACEIMTRQPGASSGDYGMEYCALVYYSGAEDAYYLSHLSDVQGTSVGRTKSCLVPTKLDDPRHLDAVILGRGHNHPHNRRFSQKDMGRDREWVPSRIADSRTGKVLRRHLLLFYREKAGECRAYKFDYADREVAALRGGVWVPIGSVSDDQGNIELYKGQDWTP